MQKKSKKIIELHWEITNTCNLHCKHCIVNGGDFNSQNEVSFEQITKFLNSLIKKYNIHIYFTGGEPFARKDFEKIIKFCVSKKIECSIITNATLLTKDNILFFKENNINLGVSLESFDKSIFENIRGINTFDKVIYNLSLIKTNDVPCTLYATLFQQNINGVKNYLESAKNFGFDVHFNQITMRGRASANKELEVKKDYHTLLEIVENAVYEVYGETLEFIEDYCWASGNAYQIDAFGNIYFCTEIKQLGEKFKIGNIKSFPFTEWLNNMYFRNFNFIKECCYSVYYASKVTLLLDNCQKCCFQEDCLVIDNYETAGNYFNILLKDCETFCRNCSYPDCLGFIWLLDKEREKMLNNGVDLLTVNNKVSFLNMATSNDLSTILDIEKPKCKLRCKNGKCKIQKSKPLVCKMYPISFYRDKNVFVWVLNIDCAYSQALIKSSKFESFLLNFYKLINCFSKNFYEELTNKFAEMDDLTSYPNGANNYVILKEV